MSDLEKLKILYSTPSVSRLFTGIYEVEKNIALQLTKLDVDVEVHGMIDLYTYDDLPNWSPIKPILYEIMSPRILGYNSAYLKNLLASNAHVGHIHSLWSYTSYALYRWSQINKKPYLFTVNGYLYASALSHSSLKKSLAFNLGFDKVIKNAGCIQVNSVAEYNSVRKLGFNNPVCIISNGVNLPDLQSSVSVIAPWSHDTNTSGKKIILYLSRIHPQKGINLLIDAWKMLALKSQLQDWHLVIVGFGKEESLFENHIRKVIKENRLNNSITLLHGQYDKQMEACYTHATGFILPSFNEGASIAALNALAFSKPAILTEGCNVVDAYAAGAAIKIETTAKSITEGMLLLINMPTKERIEMGVRGRLLVEDKYSWKSVTLKILEIYKWLNSKKQLATPSSVISD
jgi:glycosyltransferase involved in cell wall biosynthesis